MSDHDGLLLDVRGLRTEFVRKHADNFTAVADLSYSLERGKAMAIVGESGSGKSVGVRSLLKLLPKTGRITAGEAWFGGQDLLALRESALRRIRGRKIGMVFQNAMEALNPTLTLERQLTEHLVWHGICSKAEARQRAVRVLGDVGIPEPEKRIKTYPFQLSGGMRQRAMIAVALITEPDLLIADEPTTALDVTVQAQILELLAEIKDRGTGVVMITHDLGVARYFCDDVVVMNHGEVVERGPILQVLDAPREPYTKMLVSATLEVTALEEPESAPAEELGTERLVDVESVSKVFRTRAGDITAVDDVSLHINKGETLGLVGESGSGKSTVARLVMALHEPTVGRVSFAGTDLAAASKQEFRQLRSRVQMVFQNPYGSLLPHYTAGANIMEPLRLHGIGTPDERRAKAHELLELVGLSADDAERYPQQFSGGQQQRIAVARALALEPDLLVCDEPTSSLDVSIQAQVLELLASLQERLGITCLFISHNLAVVERMAHRVAVMRYGKVVEVGTAAQIFNRPQHPYTQALLDAVLPVRGPGRETVPAGE